MPGATKSTDGISLRGSVNRGFRAPSLQQTFNSVTTSTVQSGAIVQTKQLRDDDPRLAPLGVASPKAETSWNYSAGVAAQLGEHLLFTADLYQINISDRIINSERLLKSNIKALQTPDFAGISEIRFFTNAIDTRTRGLDVVATTRPSPASAAASAPAWPSRSMPPTSCAPALPPPPCRRALANRILLIDTVSIGLIERAQPRQRYCFRSPTSWASSASRPAPPTSARSRPTKSPPTAPRERGRSLRAPHQPGIQRQNAV
ncbi:MAG: TonB-dependent receptor [Hymenobacter sp.]